MKALGVLVLGFAVHFSTAVAQCPATDFSAPASGCIGEQLATVNLSSPGTYTWDFCSGDFSQSPTGQLIGTLPGVNGRPGIDFAFDTKWHAFVSGTFSNVLYRLDFDNGLQSAPAAVTNLGSLGGSLNQPGQIRMLQIAGQWYGLLHNTSGDLLKLSFGSQLSNVPTVTTLISGIGYINSGLAVGEDPVHGYVCVISTASNQFAVIRLGTALAPPDPVTDVLLSSAVPVQNNLGDVDLIQGCGSWFGFANNFGDGNIFRLDFGTSLFAAPAISQIQQVPGNPGRLRVVREADRFYLLMLALDGTLTKADFGSSIVSVPTLTNEGTLGGVLSANVYGLGMVKESSTWTLIGVNQSNGTYVRINYPDNCSASPPTSMAAEPGVSYASPGTYQVSLYTTSGMSVGVHTQLVSVSSSIAPDIDFTTVNNCAQNSVLFSSVNLSGNLVSYSWDFDDGQTSTAPNPGNVYTTAGNYTPRLVVTASNGCTNRVVRPLDIFAVPSADFTLPAVSPLCTNQLYTFDNTSIVDQGSNPTWEWRVNGVLVSPQMNLQTTFAAPVSQEVRLKALIPGCENEMIKNITTVLAGPKVDFSVGDDCAGTSVAFDNTSTGVDAGYLWNFGDGGSSAQAQPAYTYPNPGSFTITLTGSNSVGCHNQVSHPVRIYSVPQPDFSVGLPPFSCSGTPTLFQNVTPGLTDSNISDWNWSFGDPGSSTSTQRDPSFTYLTGGTYSVSLTAISDQGCSQTLNKSVSIGTSPVANFVFGPACVSQSTQFTDISTGGVQSRLWQIGTATFSSAAPSYTFASSGTYMATLTVTASGGCTNMKSIPVIVPVPPSLVISAQNPCQGQTTIFNASDNSVPPTSDGFIGWQWNIAGVTTTGNPASQVVSLSGDSPVSVTTTHASGCTYTKSSSVMIHPSPVADFTASPDRGDPPLTVQFQNLSSGASQYSWVFSGSSTGLSTATSPVYTFLELGDYTATLTAINSFGCSDIQQAQIQVLTSSVDLELLQFSLTPAATTGKLKCSLTIKNNSNIPLAAAEVALNFSGGAVVNEVLDINLSPGATTTRTLAFTFDPLQVQGGFVCAELLSEKDGNPGNNRQCISLANEEYVFDPYPNPSTGVVHLDWIATVPGSARITVFNSQGRREYEWETMSTTGLNQSVHDFGSLASGVYLVTIQTTSGTQTRRFIRQ